MKDLSYWNQFTQTGRIEDYLSYRAQETGEEREEKLPEGENPYAGISHINRDSFKGGARGGI